jgi:mRNA interferase HigB
MIPSLSFGAHVDAMPPDPETCLRGPFDNPVPLWEHPSGLMHIVSHKAIRIFCEHHPHARHAMDHWYRVAKRATWSSFAEVKQSFNAADLVAPHIVFDIGGNKYRLIAEMNFKRGVLFIRRILTHNEYMKGAWKS